MNCPRYWASIIAFYAAIGVIASLAEGEVTLAVLFGLALGLCLTIIVETWPEPTDFPNYDDAFETRDEDDE